MALTKEDKQWIAETIKLSESNLMDEVRSNRNEIRSLKQEIQDLRAQLESVNANRTEDGDAAFAEISKYAAKYKNLEARIVKLEKQFLA